MGSWIFVNFQNQEAILIFKNKLGITDSLELARKEEKISKKKAFDLFHTILLNETEIGTFKGLAKIHKYLWIMSEHLRL